MMALYVKDQEKAGSHQKAPGACDRYRFKEGAGSYVDRKDRHARNSSQETQEGQPFPTWSHQDGC